MQKSYILAKGRGELKDWGSFVESICTNRWSTDQKKQLHVFFYTLFIVRIDNRWNTTYCIEITVARVTGLNNLSKEQRKLAVRCVIWVELSLEQYNVHDVLYHDKRINEIKRVMYYVMQCLHNTVPCEVSCHCFTKSLCNCGPSTQVAWLYLSWKGLNPVISPCPTA